MNLVKTKSDAWNKKKLVRVMILTACVAAVFHQASADEASNDVVIFDLTTKSGNVFAGQSSCFSFMKGLNEMRGPNAPLLNKLDLGKAKECNTNRLFTEKGGLIPVKVYYNAATKEGVIPKDVNDMITEKDRVTKIVLDLRSAIQTGSREQANEAKPDNKASSFLGNKAPAPKSVGEYIQEYERSTITVSMDYPSNKDGVLKKEIISGSIEHMYLSADMPLTNVKQLKYDSKTSKVIEREKPASFYIGVNYKLGDVFINYDTWDLKNLSIKGLLSGSSRPSESMGLGLGYQFNIEGVSLEAFVARVWTADDDSAGGAGVGRTPSNVVGISFDVGKAASWLGGS